MGTKIEKQSDGLLFDNSKELLDVKNIKNKYKADYMQFLGIFQFIKNSKKAQKVTKVHGFDSREHARRGSNPRSDAMQ